MNSYTDSDLPRSTKSPSAAFPFDLSILDPDAVITEADSSSLKATIAFQQDLIATVGSKVLQVEARIHDLQVELAGLRLQRLALIEDHWFMKAPLAPIRRVPPEILGMIFEYCLTPNTMLSSKDAPILLAVVCRRWREVAHGTPSLWTKIHVHRDLKQPRLLKFLCHSGSLPLDITIPLGRDMNCMGINQPRGWQQWDQHYVRIMSISTHRDRIRKMAIQCGVESMATIYVLQYGYMSSLEELFVEFVDNYHEGTAVAIEAPRLRSLTLTHGATSLLSMISVGVGLRQLKLFGVIRVGAIKHFLGSSPYITELCLQALLWDELLPDCPPGAVFLPSLQRLEIRGPDKSHSPIFPQLSEMFCMPGLQSLVLSHLVSTPELSSYLGVVGAGLTHLVLAEMDLRWDDIVPMLTPLKKLEALEIRRLDEFCAAKLFLILTPDADAPASSWVCPRLTYVKFLYFMLPPSNEVLLLVERRGPSAARLAPNGSANYIANFELKGCSRLDFYLETIRAIEVLLERGQRIRIS